MDNTKNINRINWIDIAKGISMIAIVLGHTSNSGILRHYLFSFHVPIFFILSGMCFKFENTYKFVIKKIKSLLIPYFSFSIISILILFVISKISPSISDGIDVNIANNFTQMVYGSSKHHNMEYYTPLWFLTCLFSVSILVFFIEKVGRNTFKTDDAIIKFRTIIILVSLFISINISTICKETMLPWHMDTAINMLAFYIFGINIRSKFLNRELEIKKYSRTIFLASLAMIILGIIISLLNTIVVVRNDSYGVIIYYYMAAILGSIGWILISIAINKNVLLQHIGLNTIGILVMHKYPILVFQKVIPYTAYNLNNPNTFIGLMTQVMVTTITISLCLIIIKVIKRICPVILGQK